MSAVHYRYHLSNALPHKRLIFEVRIARFAARFREAVLKPECSVIHSGDPLRCFCLSIEFACLCMLAIVCCVCCDGRIAPRFLWSFSAIQSVRLASELLPWCVIVSCDFDRDCDGRKQVARDALSESFLCFGLGTVC